jgi:hypothetical protein
VTNSGIETGVVFYLQGVRARGTGDKEGMVQSWIGVHAGAKREEIVRHVARITLLSFPLKQSHWYRATRRMLKSRAVTSGESPIPLTPRVIIH